MCIYVYRSMWSCWIVQSDVTVWWIYPFLIKNFCTKYLSRKVAKNIKTESNNHIINTVDWLDYLSAGLCSFSTPSHNAMPLLRHCHARTRKDISQKRAATKSDLQSHLQLWAAPEKYFSPFINFAVSCSDIHQTNSSDRKCISADPEFSVSELYSTPV